VLSANFGISLKIRVIGKLLDIPPDDVYYASPFAGRPFMQQPQIISAVYQKVKCFLNL
jgi:hypothetical protein